MQVLSLGAGQEVGRSCIVVTLEGKTIMFDCGIHMGYSDERRYPFFKHLSSTGNFNKLIDCVIISHFHLDHCGALPYFTEVLGYEGPIYTTHPTKAILPLILEDYRKISLERHKDKLHFTKSDIEKSVSKIKSINFGENLEHEKDFFIKPYYAGHVIGAAMFYVKVKNKSVVYTGDFNTTSDKHLGSAWIDCLRPDLLITESTYAAKIRECRKVKEREFINSVQECIDRKGKVLIPINAFGRAQELFLLLDNYWDRTGLSVPIYSSSGLEEKTTSIYKLFITYMNENIREMKENPFIFKNIKPLEKSKLYDNEPMVLFASPGMLNGGVSLNVFKKWCNDKNNLVIIPGYCCKNTLGEKIVNGAKRVILGNESYEINLQVKNLGFSAHADEKGILQIVEQCQPKNVMLVHGEKVRMSLLKKKISDTFKIPVFLPKNGSLIKIPVSESVFVKVNEECFNEIKRRKEIFGVFDFEDENEIKILKFNDLNE
ncbi:hypothetical protein TUBRATIS_006620 [Tubulinosema ratisbonensis]|uniref:Integrator complex subunit 11 n=1 Tax=Tubulinosema ratisbonensis TaxID=291195 RepID=A0A437ANR2_9MICR|nr:hypothetical protein TUBRATIS_006620 [Tubulinosema ratisbonensis]